MDQNIDNPYRHAPDNAFWSRAVRNQRCENVRPATASRFKITRSDKVATAGSCFAQHISRRLRADGYRFLVTERGDEARQYGVYPARFGNIYTPRQLLQLFERAYGLFSPCEAPWRLDAAYVDPFRPQTEPGGFLTVAAVHEDRAVHLSAVRRMFETADVFVFTLGLTEAWVSAEDGAVFPSAPGVAGAPPSADHILPHNFTAMEALEDLNTFIALARTINPGLRIILTVSPVPMIATFTSQHVLAATTYTKSVLRVAAEMAAEASTLVDYFPGYEITTGAHNRHRFWEDDLRTVTPEGVTAVMAEFKRAYLGAEGDAVPAPDCKVSPERRTEHEAVGDVICDEEATESLCASA